MYSEGLFFCLAKSLCPPILQFFSDNLFFKAFWSESKEFSVSNVDFICQKKEQPC